MSTQPLRTAIIGVGAGILSSHLPALRQATFTVVGATDVNATIGAQRAAELGCPFYADHQKMLAETKPDVTVIITPHPFHASLAIDALRAGSHVIVEKPIAVTVAEADAMVETARQMDRLITVCFQQRFRADVRAAYELIHSGQLGAIQHVNMTVLWPRSKRYFQSATWRGTWKGEGGGVLLNQSPHNLDLLCHFFGLPSQVMAWVRTDYHQIETEDTVHALIEWPSGARGVFHVSTAESGLPERFEIVGTGGTLELVGGGLRFNRFAQDIRQFLAETDELYRGPKAEPVEVPLSDSKADHIAVYANLYQAVTQGSPLLTDGADARRSLELANAILYANSINQSVRFPLDRAAYTAFLEQKKS